MDKMTNGEIALSWLKRNLAIVIAFCSFGGSILGWFASYKILAYQVDLNTDQLIECKRELIDISKTLNAHLVEGHPLTREWRQDVATDIREMNRKLDRLMERMPR